MQSRTRSASARALRILVPVVAIWAHAWTGLAPASAGPPDAAEALASLQSWLDGTRDLRGRFRQRLISGALGRGVEESGRFWLERPGKMRWDYTDPERKVAILDDGRTALYVAEDRQLWEGTLSGSDGILTALLAGDRPLAEVFTISIVEDPGSGQVLLLRLVPADASGTFEEVTLEVSTPEYAVTGAEVLDSAGNRIRYGFTRLERNRGIDAERFRLEVPPGTDVVRMDRTGG